MGYTKRKTWLKLIQVFFISFYVNVFIIFDSRKRR